MGLARPKVSMGAGKSPYKIASNFAKQLPKTRFFGQKQTEVCLSGLIAESMNSGMSQITVDELIADLDFIARPSSSQ